MQVALDVFQFFWLYTISGSTCFWISTGLGSPLLIFKRFGTGSCLLGLGMFLGDVCNPLDKVPNVTLITRIWCFKRSIKLLSFLVYTDTLVSVLNNGNYCLHQIISLWAMIQTIPTFSSWSMKVVGMMILWCMYVKHFNVYHLPACTNTWAISYL